MSTRKSRVAAVVDPTTRLNWDNGSPPPPAAVNEWMVCVADVVGDGVTFGDKVGVWLGVRELLTPTGCTDVPVCDGICDGVVACDTERVIKADCVTLLLLAVLLGEAVKVGV